MAGETIGDAAHHLLSRVRDDGSGGLIKSG
jgi:hypothetical protein